MDRINNTAVATKVMVDVSRAFDEMYRLQSFGHPNIIDVRDFFESDGFCTLVMSLMNMNLLTFISDIPYGNAVALKLMTQIARGLEHMHIRGALHLDLKPENIGIVMSPNAQIQCRILDLGPSICVDSVKMGHIVHTTPEFRAPELLSGVVGFAVDIYSMGMVFAALMQGVKAEGEQQGVYDQLVSDMTNSSPDKRPVANNVLLRLGETNLGQQAVEGRFWQSMVANLVDGDPSFLVCDSSDQLHKIVTLMCSDRLESVENAFWLLQEAARKEMSGSGVSVLSIMSYVYSRVSVSKFTAFFYARAMAFLSQQPYFFLTDEARLHLWRISVIPCCEQNVLCVLARSYSGDLLIWCHLAAGWGSRRDHFVDFVQRFRHMREAQCLVHL